MARDLAKKAATMRKWRQSNKRRINEYESDRKLRRYALARARHERKPEQAARARQRSIAWRARHPNYSRTYYLLNLSHFTGSGKWGTRAVKGRAAYRKWVATLGRSRARLGLEPQPHIRSRQ